MSFFRERRNLRKLTPLAAIRKHLKVVVARCDIQKAVKNFLFLILSIGPERVPLFLAALDDD